MTFLADENVDGLVIRAVRAIGHKVLAIIETEPGISDADVLDRAFRERAILLTEDKDFGELIFRRGLPHFGVVLIRLAGCSSVNKAVIVTKTIVEHDHHLDLAFCVITEKLVRIRRSLRN